MTFLVSQAIGAVFTHEDSYQLKRNFFANFHSNGAIVASPSQHNPNYYYDWVRDSAIAMGLVERWYEETAANEYKNHLLDYVSWTETIQHQNDNLPGHDILGEPKFYVNGFPFDGPWGRPQNDGPAIRASVLTRFAHQLLAKNEREYVQTHLYFGGLDPRTMGAIKLDLEYISHHWQDLNFDLWEEILGHHFFTAMAQKNALIEGAVLAHRLHDDQAAAFYELQAKLIESRLHLHIDSTNQVIKATLPPHSGPQKTLELDSSTLLAVLLNPTNEGHFALQSALVKNTVRELHKQFNLMFPINEDESGAILFGRYPGDTYDGYHTEGRGNPWFILTATMAEYHFKRADHLDRNKANKAAILKHLNLGDDYLKLIKQHAPDLNISEQINLYTGAQQGAASLTWSYVSLLRAIDLREALEKRLGY